MACRSGRFYWVILTFTDPMPGYPDGKECIMMRVVGFMARSDLV